MADLFSAAEALRAATPCAWLADRLKVGEIIRFIDGPIAPVDCVSVSRPKACEYPGHRPFFGFWGRVREAIAGVVDQTSFADLINENKRFGIHQYR